MSEKTQRIPGRTFFQYETGDTIYIYSSLEKIVLTTDNKENSDELVYIDTNKHNKIYADTVQLNGDLVLNPKYSFQLFAREMRCLIPGITTIRSNGKSGDAIKSRPIKANKAGRGIDGKNKSGEPYHCTENTQDGHPGAHADASIVSGNNGNNGGEIVLYAHKLVLPDDKSRLSCEALGGNGQQGQDGQDGGDGGAGFYRLYDRFLGKSIYQSGYGGQGGNATYGGKGGDGGNGGTISIWIESASFGTDDIRNRGGAGGKKGNNGTPGTGGKHSNNRSDRSTPGLSYEVTSGSWDAGYTTITYWRIWEKRKDGNRDDREVSTTQAPNGGYTGTAKPDGSSGKEGITNLHFNPDTLASATHLMMLLERAQAMHLIAGLRAEGSISKDTLQQSFKSICELLDWIIQRSAWVQDEGRKKAANRNPLEVRAFEDVFNTAKRLRSYAAAGLSPFGENILDPVIPNLSYDTLDTFLRDNIENLRIIEKEYHDALEAENGYGNEQNAFSRRTNANIALSSITKEQKSKCLEVLRETAAEIESIDQSVFELKEQLIDRADAFKAAVTAFQFPTWSELVEAATMIAFTKYLAPVEGIDLLVKGITETSSDDETKIKKDLIIQETGTLKEDLEGSLRTSYSSLGTIESGEQKLLLADLAQYNKIVQKFMRLSSAKELHQLIQTFFSTVSGKNDLIIQYNNLILKIAQLDERLKNLDAEQAQNLADMSALNDPAVAYLTASLARRYGVVLERCAHELCTLERAYRYSTLEDTSKIFRDLFSVDMQWGGSRDILYHLTPGKLRDCKQELAFAYKSYLNDQTNQPARFPIHNADPGIILKLQPNDKKPGFIKGDGGYAFEFSIVRTQKEQEESSGFGRYIHELASAYDVRLSGDKGNAVKLRVTLHDGHHEKISAILFHGARDTIYGKYDTFHQYQLRSGVNFETITEPQIVGSEYLKKALLQSELDQEVYRRIGPYGKWRLFLPTKNGANPNLDPATIKEFELEFSVTFRG
ncbi:MAG: hypothetical protein LZF61_08325 [Nitrosomonas sp.]|nr:MAG: hypothetical protein LZF61_08325 [Nitrosomonas sp.]